MELIYKSQMPKFILNKERTSKIFQSFQLKKINGTTPRIDDNKILHVSILIWRKNRFIRLKQAERWKL